MSGANTSGMSQKEVNTGRVLNVVATAGGANAMRMATGEFREALRNNRRAAKDIPHSWKVKSGRAAQPPAAPEMRKPLREALKTGLKTKSGRVGLAATGGMLLLHTGELTGDAISARALHAQAQQFKKEFGMSNEQGISKAYQSPQARTTGRGMNIEKAFRSHEDKPESTLVPGYGWVNGRIKRRPATRGEKAVGALGGGLTGAVLGGYGGAANAALRGGKPVLIPISAALGAGLGAGLGYMGSRYTREFHANNPKHKGAKHKAGKYVTSREQAESIRNTNYMVNRQRAEDVVNVLGASGVFGKAFARPNETRESVFVPGHGVVNGTMRPYRVDGKTRRKWAAAGGAAGAGLALGGLISEPAEMAMHGMSNKKSVLVGGGTLLGAGVLGGALAHRGAKWGREFDMDRSDIRAINRRTKVGKAYRRFDPEADRQRRIGMYGGLLGGASIALASPAISNLSRAGIKVTDLKAGKKGALYALGSLGAAGAGAAAYRHSVKVRNQPWT